MLKVSSRDIVGDADIKCAARAGHDIDIIQTLLHIHSLRDSSAAFIPMRIGIHFARNDIDVNQSLSNF